MPNILPWTGLENMTNHFRPALPRKMSRSPYCPGRENMVFCKRKQKKKFVIQIRTSSSSLFESAPKQKELKSGASGPGQSARQRQEISNPTSRVSHECANTAHDPQNLQLSGSQQACAGANQTECPEPERLACLPPAAGLLQRRRMQLRGGADTFWHDILS